MLVIIFSGLAILPLLIICFGGLFLRSYMSRRTMLTMMLVGVSALIVELFNLYQLVHMHIDLRQWIFISDLLAVFPIYSSLTIVVLAMIVYMIFEGNQLSKMTLTALSLLLLVVVTARATAFEDQLSELAINKKMLNEELTVQDMQQIATIGTVKEKIFLATRGDLTLEIVQKLLQDPSEIIRFYGLVNPAVQIKDLEQLKESDKSAEIRKQAAIEIKKRKTN